MRIAIAGAFGFIGQHLINGLLQSTDNEIVAFSRSPRSSGHQRINCVTVDFFSLRASIAAFKNCDVAVYLVHSMAPGSRLSQGNFRDYDYILADNFARAAKANGVNHIVYVGGIIPESTRLSAHLKSRLEVESVLRSYGIPLTTLRCGLVIGKNGSSFNIIVRLTERLPVMILPRWMRTRSSPIYVSDLASVIIKSLENPPTAHRIIDTGMETNVTYKDIVQLTARELGKKSRFIDTPYVSPNLSKLWVRLVSGASKSLIYPLIDSVTHEMITDTKRSVPGHWEVRLRPLDEAIHAAFSKQPSFVKPKFLPTEKQLSEVRSVQRMQLPPGESAESVAVNYFHWLPQFLKPFIKITSEPFEFTYRLRLFSTPLIRLYREPLASHKERELYKIKDGMLVAPHGNGRLEFRVSRCSTFLIVALHNYRPALPWPVYRWTQAILHRMVMKSFDRHLKKQERKIAGAVQSKPV